MDEILRDRIMGHGRSDSLCNTSTSLINEILAYQSVTPIPNAHSCVEGIFMPRNKMITAIDLGGCLQIGTANSNGFLWLRK